MAASRIKDMTCLSEIVETVSHTATRASSEDTSDTQPQYYADALRLLINNIEDKFTEFPNKTATLFS